MPKNAHPPRGKTVKKTVPPEEDTSYIVFGDGKPKKKRGEGSSQGNEAQGEGKAKGKGTPGEPEDAPKKPDTRTLIGGSSWTGKLPVNLLQEHFQKQQWSKPDYRIVSGQERVQVPKPPLTSGSVRMGTSTLPTPSSCRS